MAPLQPSRFLEKRFPVPEPASDPPLRKFLSTEGGFLEAWAQGYHVGSLIILMLIVFCNYRSGILLHKLILLELILALWHGTFIFVSDPYYGWYLSSTATLLFISYQLHNVVSWLKIRPFLPRWGSHFFIFSLLAVQPFWVAEAWSNFAYFNSLGSNVNERMRPYEALLRDPWWIFTTWKLVSAIKKTYGFKLVALVKINPRFGVMLACMFISIAFLLTDIAVNAAQITSNSGINPYWRFALVFKCASDTIFLDDFKSVLDDIVARKMSHAGGHAYRGGDGGGIGRSSNGNRKRLADPDSIDREPPLPKAAPVTRVTPLKPASQKLGWLPSRPQRLRPSVSGIRVQKETIVMSEMRQQRNNSWGSEHEMLQAPRPAVYSKKKRNSSSGSLKTECIGGSNS